MISEQEPVPEIFPAFQRLIQQSFRVQEIRYVVTLVHGTWANKEEWYQENGSLAKSIGALLPGAIFKSFKWSGANSILDRAEAADRLGEQLKGQLENPSYAKAKHI